MMFLHALDVLVKGGVALLAYSLSTDPSVKELYATLQILTE